MQSAVNDIMACRKAADRALMQLGEWLQEQEEKNEAKYQSLVEEQWQFWCPHTEKDWFERTYCVRWLAKGPEVPGGGNGCSGGCGKAHPRVVLDYNESNGGYTVATLSHPLIPFQTYFEKLVQEGRAVRTNSEKTAAVAVPATTKRKQHNNSNLNPPFLTYSLLTGFIPTHLEDLKAEFHNHHHLIKVASHEALAVSTTAYRNHLLQEHEARAAKKQRTIGPAAETELMEQALQICLDTNSLLDHLDLAEIACMRCTNRVMRKIAQPMISRRMQQLKLSYTVLGPEGEIAEDESSDAKKGILNKLGQRDDYVVKCSQEPLAVNTMNKINSDEPCAFQFQPKEPAGHETRWAYQEYQNHEMMTESRYDRNTSRRKQRDHVIQLYLHDHGDDVKKSSIPLRLVESHSLFNKARRPFFLEVARFRINHYQYLTPPEELEQEREDRTHHFNRIVTCDQLSGHLNCHITELPVERLIENESTRIVKRSGTFSVQEIHYSFQDLLGVYVRKQLPVAKQKLADLREQRPLLKQEREYVKVLARMARNAPGNSQAFARLEGW